MKAEKHGAVEQEDGEEEGENDGNTLDNEVKENTDQQRISMGTATALSRTLRGKRVFFVKQSC